MLKGTFSVAIAGVLLLNILSTINAAEHDKSGPGATMMEPQRKEELFLENLPKALAFIKEFDREFYDLVTQDDKLKDEYKRDFLKYGDLWLEYQETASPRAEIELKLLILSRHLDVLQRQYTTLVNKGPQKQIPQSPVSQGNAETYAKDVEFLLVELEKRAGHFFSPKGVDWPQVSAQFRAEVKTIKSNAEHVKLCARLMTRLRDGHAGLTELRVPWPDESKSRRWEGPQVHLLTQDNRVYIRQAFGHAADKGIRVGMEVLRVNGLPARKWLNQRIDKLRDERGYSTDHQASYAACHWGMAHWSGTPIEFELHTGEKKKTVTLTCQGGTNFVPVGPVFPPEGLQRIGRQSYGKTAEGFGYIHLRDTPGILPRQLDAMLESIGPVPGLILDCRANGGGGCDHSAVFGRFVPAGQTWRQYPSAGDRPFAGPMVVIVDPGTRSAGETVSGMFKEDGRAYMIGEGPTAGTSSQKQTVTVPSGMFSVRFSVASNKRRFNQMRGIEGIGVPPHEVVPYDLTQLAAGVDTQIKRAEQLLRQELPANQVPYETVRPAMTAQVQKATATLSKATPLPPIPSVNDLSGDLIFHGRYHHRSRRRDIDKPSELWLKQTPDGAITALAHLPSLFGSRILASGNPDHQLVRYRSSQKPANPNQPLRQIDLEFGEGKAYLSRRNLRQDHDRKELSVPEGARFNPNTRPDSYCAAIILLRACEANKGESGAFRVYDWDNSGNALTDYTIRIDSVGKEKIEVPAGTFDAHHYKLTQLTTANTWFKKRAGHITEFWILDNGVLARVLRHREPYEMLLLDYTVCHPTNNRDNSD
ncbi:MAG: S41 family peptidase [Planctomycetota bacterium]|jgi:hypothetical protein